MNIFIFISKHQRTLEQKVFSDQEMGELDCQVENQPRAAYIGRTALVCVEECVHSVMFLKKQLQA